MPTITLKEAKKRSKLDLISDKDIHFYSRSGLMNVRESQKEMERRYPVHRLLREHSIKYFLNKNYDVYPRGIAVRNTYSSPDFAIFKTNTIIFVECLTAHRVYSEHTFEKRKVEEFAPIIFIVPIPSIVEFEKSYQRRDYIRRIRCLAKDCKVYCCHSDKGYIQRFK